MRVSFNEIEMTVLRAARGAGMAWGLAEEAASCARWLALFGLPWQGAVLATLQAGDWRSPLVHDSKSLCPEPPFEWLCPVTAGAYLSDLGAAHTPELMKQVRRPILLLPFVARLRRRLRLSWRSARVWLDVGEAAVEGNPADLDPPFVDRVTIKDNICALPAALPRRHDPTVDIEIWDALKRLEARTYVPATVRSRVGGAGPATGDND
jgi:hypothetical protein